MSNAAQRAVEAWSLKVHQTAERMAGFMERLDPVWAYEIHIIERLYADDLMATLDREGQQAVQDLGRFVVIAIRDRKRGLRKYFVQPGGEDEMEKVLTGLADLWRTELFADFGLTLEEGNAMLQNILNKLDEVSSKLDEHSKELKSQGLALATLTEKASSIEKSIDGQRGTRRWIVGTIIAVGALVGWQNLVALWNTLF